MLSHDEDTSRCKDTIEILNHLLLIMYMVEDGEESDELEPIRPFLWQSPSLRCDKGRNWTSHLKHIYALDTRDIEIERCCYPCCNCAISSAIV
jgi:hypothetical protein